MYQRYDTATGSSLTSRLIVNGQQADRWVVARSGVTHPDRDRPVPLGERTVVTNAADMSGYAPGDVKHPVFSGGADAAVDATLDWMDWFYDDRDPLQVVWADIHPIREGAADVLDTMRVYGDTWATPAATVGGLGEPTEGLEFRPLPDRPYMTLEAASKRLFIREDNEDLTVAVVPRRESEAGRTDRFKEAWLGEIHIRDDEGVRVWPMDWRWMMNAPDLDQAAEAASKHLRLWQLKYLRSKGEHPDAVGRLYRFDGGYDGWGTLLYGNGAGETWQIRPEGRYERWNDPFHLDRPSVSEAGLSL